MGQAKRPDARNQLAQMQERMRQNVKYAGPDSDIPTPLAIPESSTTETVGEMDKNRTPGAMIQIIPLDRITVREGFNVRSEILEDEELNALAQSMKQLGLIHPITVIAQDDHYAVVSGHRRLQAAYYLQWATIPAVIQTWDEQTQTVANYVENRHRAAVSPFDEARRAVMLMERHGWSLRETATQLHESLGRLSALVRIYRNPQLRLAMESDQLPLRWLNRFTVLVDREGVEHIPGAIDAYLTWISKEHPTWERFLEALAMTQGQGALPGISSRSASRQSPLFDRVWTSAQHFAQLAERYQAKLSPDELLSVAQTLIAQGESLAETARRRSDHVSATEGSTNTDPQPSVQR